MNREHANPVMEKAAEEAYEFAGEGKMTATGSFRWLGCFAAVTMFVGYLTMTQTASNPSAALPVLLVGLFGGLIVAFIIIANPRTAPVLGWIYAALEGLALGGVSAFADLKVPGVAAIALVSTAAVFGVMFLVYASGLFRPSGRFIEMLTYALLGVLAFYIIDLLAVFFGGSGFSFLHEATPFALAVSVGICLLASFCLLADFSMMDEMIHRGAGKRFEAFAAFGVMVTLVWLYVELLRLVMIVSELFGDE